MSNQPFIPGGGVDLAALAAAREAQQRAAENRASAPEGVIVEPTEETFEQLVIQQSMTVPVIVDLRSDRATGSAQLSPLLESVVLETGGRLVLASVDVDAQPRIAAAFRVQAVPSVFAVIAGQVLPLFQGPQPEAQLKAYLVEVLKAAEQAGITGVVGAAGEATAEAEPEDEGDPRLDDAADAIDRGDWDAAVAAYEAILADNPADEWATIGLAQVKLMRRTEGQDLSAAVAAAEANPSDVDAATVAADAAVMSGEVAAGFAILVEAVRLTSGDERDRARSHLLELFEIVGADHPDVAPARLALSNALF